VNDYDLVRLEAEARRYDRGWRPTKKQGLTVLGMLAIVGVAIVQREPPPIVELASIADLTGSDTNDAKPERRAPRGRRFGRLRRWWRGSQDDEYQDAVVHPDERGE
jgi:hypothetical protein